MTTPADSPSPRLRDHPRDRFAEPVREFNLDASTASLRAEPGTGQHGHRQIALYRHGPSTVALYLFDQSAELREHVVDGFVTIHVLDGRLVVHAKGQTHDLAAGNLLTIAPNVPHDVQAREASRMLLTISLEGRTAIADQE